MVALVAAALSAAHGYMAWRGARIAEAAAMDNLAVESKAGVNGSGRSCIFHRGGLTVLQMKSPSCWLIWGAARGAASR